MTDTRSGPLIPENAHRRRETCPYLYLVIEAARPRAGGSRYALSDVDEVKIGRGADRTAVRQGRSLIITVPDKWMSSSHADLRLEHVQWTIVDRGSKHGTYVNGKR